MNLSILSNDFINYHGGLVLVILWRVFELIVLIFLFFVFLFRLGFAVLLFFLLPRRVLVLSFRILHNNALG